MKKGSKESASKRPSLLKQASLLFEEQSERDRFLGCVDKKNTEGRALIWINDKPSVSPFNSHAPQIWQPNFVERVFSEERPGAHHLHDAGAYYCLDFSSIFEASPILSIENPPKLVLDLCASPGGKSVFTKALYPTCHLISNEVIGKRLAPLISNLKRCNLKEVTVTSQDPKLLSEKLLNSCDLTIVDAPCSGQSLLFKKTSSFTGYHPKVIKMNARRQKRILAHACETVTPGGYLAYMTCTFSKEENEINLEWVEKSFPEFKAVEVPQLAEFRSKLSDLPCYRLFPQHGLGAGGFTALLRRIGTRSEPDLDVGDLAAIWRA